MREYCTSCQIQEIKYGTLWLTFESIWSDILSFRNKDMFSTADVLIFVKVQSTVYSFLASFTSVTEWCSSDRTTSSGTSFLLCLYFALALRASVAQRGYGLRLLIFKMANSKVDSWKIRSEDIVYIRFIKISLGSATKQQGYNCFKVRC